MPSPPRQTFGPALCDQQITRAGLKVYMQFENSSTM